MTRLQRAIDSQACIHAFHAITLRRELGVVPGAEAFELSPTHPARRQWALVPRVF